MTARKLLHGGSGGKVRVWSASGALQPGVIVRGVQERLRVRAKLPVENLRVLSPDAEGEDRADVADHGLSRRSGNWFMNWWAITRLRRYFLASARMVAKSRCNTVDQKDRSIGTPLENKIRGAIDCGYCMSQESVQSIGSRRTLVSNCVYPRGRGMAPPLSVCA